MFSAAAIATASAKPSRRRSPAAHRNGRRDRARARSWLKNNSPGSDDPAAQRHIGRLLDHHGSSLPAGWAAEARKDGSRTMQQKTLDVSFKPRWACSKCSAKDGSGDVVNGGASNYCYKCKTRKGLCHWKNIPPRNVEAAGKGAGDRGQTPANGTGKGKGGTW